MTNELEKQFFNAFGIKPRGKKCTCDVKDFAKCTTYYCTSCEKAFKKEYPQITDSIYLMLLATLTCICSIEFPFADVKKLKEDVLKETIKHQYGFDKQQVQALFEEG